MNFLDRLKTAIKITLGDLPRSFFSGILGGGNYVRRSGVQQDPYGNLLGWVYFAIDKVAQRVASIDLELYELRAKGEVEQIFDHELLSVLYRANPHMTKTDLWYISVIYLRIWGSSPWYIEMNGRKVLNVWPMRPDLLRPIQTKNGQVVRYEYRVGDQVEEFDASEVIYIRKPAPENPMKGYSALFSAALEIDADFAAAIWNRHVLENSAEPGGVLTTEGELSQDSIKKLRDVWHDRYSGPTNSGRTAILQKGLKYQAISQSQKELDFIESRKFSRDTILTLLGVPKALVIADDVNRANAETAERVFAKETVEPIMHLIVDQLNEFFVIKFGDNLWLDFQNPAGADSELKRLENQAGINTWKTINEVREEYNLAPLDGGDVLYMPFSVAPMVGEGAIDPTEDVALPKSIQIKEFKLKAGSFMDQKKKRIKQAVLARTYRKREVLAKITDHIYKGIAKQLKGNKIKLKGVKVVSKDSSVPIPEHIQTERKEYLKGLPKKMKVFQRMMRKFFNAQEKIVIDNLRRAGDPKELLNNAETKDTEFKGWLERVLFNRKKQVEALIVSSTSLYEDNLTAGASAIATILGVGLIDIVANPSSVQFLKDKPMQFAESVNDTTIQALRDTLSEGVANTESVGELGDRIAEVFDDARGFRTETIARTEVGSALNFGRNEEMGMQGIEQKQWLAIFSNTREDHAEADGQIVAINEMFVVGGEELEYPQDPSGSAGNVINCQCSVSPYIST